MSPDLQPAANDWLHGCMQCRGLDRSMQHADMDGSKGQRQTKLNGLSEGVGCCCGQVVPVGLSGQPKTEQVQQMRLNDRQKLWQRVY